MNPLYVQLITLGLNFLTGFLQGLTTNQAPAEVVQAVESAVLAMTAHKQDLMSKADWEAARG